jgi:hypothetical protein
MYSYLLTTFAALEKLSRGCSAVWNVCQGALDHDAAFGFLVSASNRALLDYHLSTPC